MKKSIVYATLLLLVFVQLSCDESLPARIEPENFIAGDFRLMFNRMDVCASNLTPRITAPISVGVKNIFDETLENSLKIKVNLTIWTKYWPDIKSTINLEKIDPNKIITIDPGTTYWVEIDWDHKVDDGRYIWEAVRPSIQLTKWGNKIEFFIAGTIQVFSNVQAIPTKEFEFSLIYVLNEKC